MFPFVVRWDDVTPGSAVDMSSLNSRPAGANGRIVVKDGHFVESATGRRITFVGVDFTGSADYPTHADAEKVAERLAKMGVNIVRIHHHDIRGVRGQSMLWNGTPSDPATFSTQGRDRLDYLIYQLKMHGIYVNLNLHVSRAYLPSDGFPESVLKIGSVYDKQVDIYDRQMIKLQKQFARDYLGHVNPYTSASYLDDPCVAVVEINNENSLVGWPGDRTGFFDQLPAPFRDELVGFWNRWLKRTYGSDSAIRAAWATSFPAGGAGQSVLITPGAHSWTLEDATHAARLIVADAAAPSGPTVQIDTPVKPEQDWQVQAKLDGLDLTEGQPYVLTFRARSDVQRTARVSASIDHEDWRNVGLAKQIVLTTGWQSYRMVFIATNSQPDHDRLVFDIGGATGAVWINDVQLRNAAIDDVLPPDHRLSAANIDIPTGGAPAAVADWTRFLVDTEQSYADEMRQYLRDDLGAKACVVDTQMGYGGLSSFAREAGSDYRDAHAYWQHPKFPGKSWDHVNWQIANTPMVSDLAAGKMVTFNQMAFDREAGKPFSVSEYNHPAPSDYQAEMMPMLSSYAALQDWDMIYAFEYGQYASNATLDHIQGFFEIAQNPAKEAFFPSAALIMREAEISPLGAAMSLKIAPGSVASAASVSGEWQTANGGKPFNLLSARFEASIAPGAHASKIVQHRAKRAGGASARIVSGSAGAIYAAHGKAAVVAAGFLGGQSVDEGEVSITCPEFGDNFAAMTLVSIDREPLTTSRRILLTIVGRAANVDMQWNDTRTSVGNKWGHGPSQAEGIPATITLNDPSIKNAWALDAGGARSQEIPLTIENGRATFAIGPKYKTVWYELSAEQNSQPAQKDPYSVVEKHK